MPSTTDHHELEWVPSITRPRMFVFNCTCGWEIGNPTTQATAWRLFAKHIEWEETH
jgi:hypothetical protein